MSYFRNLLDEVQPGPGTRRWVYVPYDQLSDQIGPLSREEPDSLGIVLIENNAKAARRPYHQQKLALILANQRHFALEQAGRGVAVRYLATSGLYRDALALSVAELGPLRVMAPAERELRADLKPLIEDGGLEIIPHEGWLTATEDFLASQPKGPPWRMDAFYRHVRRSRGVLMDDGKPRGGKYSFDAENRLAWKGEPPAPQPPDFPLDEVKVEVGDLIRRQFADHPGRLDLEAIPSTQADAERLWDWAKHECLTHFGPYQDAMSSRSSGLFHTRVSALLNIQRLLPGQLIADAEQLDAPLSSVEGFVRQVLGWREYVRHVHDLTDGFRESPSPAVTVTAKPGDGGYARWAGKPWADVDGPSEIDGGARVSALGSDQPLPPAFWGRPSGLRCLDRCVADVWRSGYGHHISRLMVLANLATLLDVDPRELTDWFWVAYADAYDWVVEPNVLGMGTYAVGDLMTTKPYVAGAAYINRMSDYCGDCDFDPKRNCPIARLYWAFLARHNERLQSNPRIRLPLASLDRRDPSQRRQDDAVHEWVLETLSAGQPLTPAGIPEAEL